jgi:hypothetical protein
MRIFCLILIACLRTAAQEPKPVSKVPHVSYLCDMYNDPIEVERVVDGKVQPPEDRDNWNVRCTVQIDSKVVSDERLQLPEFASFAQASAAVTTYQKSELPRILEDHGLLRASRRREKAGEVSARASWQ